MIIIDSYTIDMINKISLFIRKTYNLSTPIIDLSKFIEKDLQGTIEQIDYLPNYLETWLEKKDNTFKIFVLKNLEQKHKNFCIAHQLGHLFIHMGYKINDKLWKESENIFNTLNLGESDFQANEFAASLLMPKNEFIETMFNNFDYIEKSYNMDKVAKHFNVNLEGAVNRAKWLRLLI